MIDLQVEITVVAAKINLDIFCLLKIGNPWRGVVSDNVASHRSYCKYIDLSAWDFFTFKRSVY